MPDDIVDPVDLDLDNPGEGKKEDDKGGGQEPPKGFLDDAKYAGLDESFRKRLAKFKSEEDVFKSYVSLEEKLGKSIVPPAEDASREEWLKFFDRIGRPEKPDDYKLPEGMKFQPEVEKAIREKLHSAGVPKTQVGFVLEAITESAKVAKAMRERDRAALETSSIASLKEEFGDKYEVSVAAATEAAKTIFPETVRAKLQAAGLGQDADFVRAMKALADKMGESKFVFGDPAKAGKKDPYEYMRTRYGSK